MIPIYFLVCTASNGVAIVCILIQFNRRGSSECIIEFVIMFVVFESSIQCVYASNLIVLGILSKQRLNVNIIIIYLDVQATDYL